MAIFRSPKIVTHHLRVHTQQQAAQLAINLQAEFKLEQTRIGAVLTGWSRANWLLGAGKLRREHVGSKTLEPETQPQRDEEGIRAVLSANNGTELHVSNVVPYIRKLNEGPKYLGFVENVLRRVARRNRRRQ